MQTNNTTYEDFLPEVGLHISPKKDVDEAETTREIKVAVQTVFRSAVIEFMRDSELYRVELPIDVYEGVQRYDLIPPEGFMVHRVVGLKDHNATVPKNCFDKKQVMLTCCPTKDLDEAFYVEVALLPKRNQHCEFDCDFVNEHYDAILSNMLWRLADMQARTWSFTTKVDRLEKRYYKNVTKAKRNALNGGALLRLKVRPMSSNSIGGRNDCSC